MDLRQNNFDAVRTGLALIVVFSHIASLTQLASFNSFHYFFDSEFAVKGFFAISGFLVTKSFYSSRSKIEFFEKRARRIYPAYLAVILFGLAIGTFMSDLNIVSFWSAPETFKYIGWNAVGLNFMQPSLPGLFTNHYLPAVNGSLWTIKIEAGLYLCVPFIAWTFSRFGISTGAALVYLASVAYAYFFTHIYSGPAGAEIARQFPGQLTHFVAGAYLYSNRQAYARLPQIVLAAFVAFLIFRGTSLRLIVEPIYYASLVMFVATQLKFRIPAGRWGDLSYGLYLFHFPIVQVLILCGLFAFNPWLGLLATLIATVGMSLLSWHLLEKRCLKRSSHYLRNNS